MANQPTPNRPWFRLASIRVPPTTPAPTGEPRPSMSRPTFQALAPTTSQPQPPVFAPPPPARPADPPSVEPPASAPPPAPAVTLAPSAGTTSNATDVASSAIARVSAPASLPTSPVSRAVRSTTLVPTSPAPKPDESSAGANQPLKPMKLADETPPQSPKVKFTARLPSPLTLPPLQLKLKEETNQPKIPGEPEPKTVLVQKTIEKPKSSYSDDGEFRNSGEVRKSEKQEASKDVETKDRTTHRKVSVSKDGGARVIILAGENKGAVMELIQSPKKHGFGTNPNRLHEKGSPSIKSTGGRQWDTYSSSSNEDENVKRKDTSHEGKTKASPPLIAYMNSNVQGINNSIMYHSKCHDKDPGIHLVVSREPFSDQGASYRTP